jgi:predicted TIM-barrel fold metal-dependent hydrolase
MKVIDGHVHVSSTRFLPRSLIEASVRNMTVALEANGLPYKEGVILESYLSKLQDHNCDEFVREMDEAGVDQAVLLLPDFTYAVKDAELDIAEMIRQHAEIIKRHPGRCYYMCGLAPQRGREAVDIFEHAVTEQGCSGLKLYPPCGYGPSDKRLYPYYEICRAHGLPVLLHTGPTAPLLTFNYSDPMLIDDAARQFSDVSFILAHGGVNNVEASCLLGAYRPNVYLDFSGYAASVDSEGPESSLRRLFARNLSHKLIFGTDWPIFKLRGPYEELVAKVIGEDGAADELAEREAALVLGGTVQRLFGCPRTCARPMR